MKLTDEQKKQVLKKLEKFSSTNKCHCGNDDWLFSDKIFEIREFHGGNLVVGGNSSIMPVIAASCSECGHTQFYNALMLGLVEDKDGGKE